MSQIRLAKFFTVLCSFLKYAVFSSSIFLKLKNIFCVLKQSDKDESRSKREAEDMLNVANENEVASALLLMLKGDKLLFRESVLLGKELVALGVLLSKDSEITKGQLYALLYELNLLNSSDVNVENYCEKNNSVPFEYKELGIRAKQILNKESLRCRG